MLGFLIEGLGGLNQYLGLQFHILLNWIWYLWCMLSVRKKLCCSGYSHCRSTLLYLKWNLLSLGCCCVCTASH